MGQGEFDFESFQEKVAQRREAEVTEAREGLKILEERHNELTTQRCALDEQIEAIDGKISELRGFLGEEKEKEKTATPKRDRGVLVVLRQILGPDFCEPRDFEYVVKRIRQIKPTAKEATIRSGLLRLVRDGTLVVQGSRGDRTWRLVEVVEKAPEPAEEPEPETKAQEPAEETPAPESAPTRPHDEIVADVCERIMKAATKAKDGIDAKTVAWIMSEAGADEGHFEAAVKQLEGEGKVEVGKSLKDESTVIRLPAEPDSKEELKRTRVGGTPLFPNADKPAHA